MDNIAAEDEWLMSLIANWISIMFQLDTTTWAKMVLEIVILVLSEKTNSWN